MSYWTNHLHYAGQANSGMQVGQRIQTQYGPAIIMDIQKAVARNPENFRLLPWIATIWVPSINFVTTLQLSFPFGNAEGPKIHSTTETIL